MLFTAGMGIGLMFFGIAEPIMHYVSPPSGEPETILAAQQSMRVTFFHWGLHAWGFTRLWHYLCLILLIVMIYP